MEYRSDEEKYDNLQNLIGISAIGIISIFQLLFFYITEIILLKLYYYSVGVIMIIDLFLTLKILVRTTDYDKHRLLRSNIGVWAAILFAHLFLIAPIAVRIINGFSTDYIAYYKMHWIITAILIFKIFIHRNLFQLLQKSHRALLKYQ